MKVDFYSKEEIEKMIKKETLFLREEEGELWAYRIFKRWIFISPYVGAQIF